MIKKEFLGILLLLLPLLPLLALILAKSSERRKNQEIILITTIIFCAFFSYPLVKLATDFYPPEVNSLSFYKVFFATFFSNLTFPLIYFASLLLVYFFIIRPKISQEN